MGGIAWPYLWLLKTVNLKVILTLYRGWSIWQKCEALFSHSSHSYLCHFWYRIMNVFDRRDFPDCIPNWMIHCAYYKEKQELWRKIGELSEMQRGGGLWYRTNRCTTKHFFLYPKKKRTAKKSHPNAKFCDLLSGLWAEMSNIWPVAASKLLPAWRRSMLSTILITFIYCGPNKWNNQRPLIDTASRSWGCMGVLKGRSGKRPESPLESCAVINERRTGTNYTHRPNQKEIHTLTHTCKCTCRCIQFISVSFPHSLSPVCHTLSFVPSIFITAMGSTLRLKKWMLLHSSDALSLSLLLLSSSSVFSLLTQISWLLEVHEVLHTWFKI